MTVTSVPPLEGTVEARLPGHVNRTLPNGLRVLAVQQPGVPLIELRLHIPIGLLPASADAVPRILAATVLAGTDRYDWASLADRLQGLGGGLDVQVDADRLLFEGYVVADRLQELLSLLSDVLTTATHPSAEVATERDRLLQKLQIARSRPGVRAHVTLHRHMFGDHPYGRVLPTAEQVEAVDPVAVRALHERCIGPAGSTLVLVGDLDATTAADLAERTLTAWPATAAPPPLPPLPTCVTDPSVLVHRAGSVQSSIRIGGVGLSREDPRFAALQLANLLYGGYFSSRLVANIREDKGYTYSPRSRVEHGTAGSTLLVQADVATGVTAPALLEMWYELGRLSTLPPTPQELADVRQYAVGSFALTVSSQAGLASIAVELAGIGLDLDWIPNHMRRLARVTADDIYDMGVHIMAPHRLAVTIVGDATRTADQLSAFGPWEVRFAPQVTP